MFQKAKNTCTCKTLGKALPWKRLVLGKGLSLEKLWAFALEKAPWLEGEDHTLCKTLCGFWPSLQSSANLGSYEHLSRSNAPCPAGLVRRLRLWRAFLKIEKKGDIRNSPLKMALISLSAPEPAWPKWPSVGQLEDWEDSVLFEPCTGQTAQETCNHDRLCELNFSVKSTP